MFYDSFILYFYQDFHLSGDDEQPLGDGGDSREDLDSSIKDLEFRLTNNLEKLRVCLQLSALLTLL